MKQETIVALAFFAVAAIGMIIHAIIDKYKKTKNNHQILPYSDQIFLFEFLIFQLQTQDQSISGQLFDLGKTRALPDHSL